MTLLYRLFGLGNPSDMKEFVCRMKKKGRERFQVSSTGGRIKHFKDELNGSVLGDWYNYYIHVDAGWDLGDDYLVPYSERPIWMPVDPVIEIQILGFLKKGLMKKSLDVAEELISYGVETWLCSGYEWGKDTRITFDEAKKIYENYKFVNPWVKY